MNKRTVVWLLAIGAGLCAVLVLLGGGLMLFGSGGLASLAPAPVVQIFYPPELAEVPYGSPIPVGVEASVPEGNQVTRLELWADRELVGLLEGDQTALTASWYWLPKHASQHVLVGRAFNQDGVEGSAIVTVEVRTDLPDGDQDGVADQQDECPDQVGAPEWNGCPPGGPLGESWGPGGDPSDGAEEIVDEAGPPSEDPPWVVPDPDPDPDPDPPPPMALLEVEGLNLLSAVGARDVYCYLTLTSRPLERVPSDAEGNFTENSPGNWNIFDFMGGLNGRMADVPEAGTLHMEVDCWGHFSDDPLDPDVRHMGIYVADHGPGDWDGREFVGHGAMDANWFDLTYRICRVNCEETTLPAPYNLILADVGPNYELSWNWDGDPSVDNSNVGFHVYRDGIIIYTMPFNNPINTIFLVPAEAEPPLCNQEYRFEVRAVRGADLQLSDLSNTQWAISPDPCPGENRLAIHGTSPAPAGRLTLVLEHYYIGDFSERVVVGAIPLIDGSFVPMSFIWDGTSVSTGGGIAPSHILYLGTEPLTTNGLRLFMLTIADGINPPGVMIYSRDIDFEYTWQGGMPDLRIMDVNYPESGDVLHINVKNVGLGPLIPWDPTFAFYQEVGGVRTRVAGLDSPIGLPSVIFRQGDERVIAWPGWDPAVNFPLLEPQYEVVVDPDNLIAEMNEENNVFLDSKPNVTVTLEKFRVLAYGSSDAAGYPGCFAGLTAFMRVGGLIEDYLYMRGVGIKMTYPTFFNWARPHELGLLVCPPQEFDVETELLPALKAGSCMGTASAYFGAHGQPIFAEGVHPFLPIAGWGTDYSSACYTLAGQTTLSRDEPVFQYGYTGGDLDISAGVTNVDIAADGSWTYDQFCNFTEAIPAGDMAALPIVSRVLTDPGGACEVVVSVESFP